MTEDEYTCALNVGDTVKVRGGFTRGRVTRSEWREGPESEYQVLWPDGRSQWYSRTGLVLIQRGCDEEALAALRAKLHGPSWNDVKPGDTVRFKFRGQEYTTEAYRMNVSVVCVMGISISGVIVRMQYELLSITKPTPPLPTKPGTALNVVGRSGLVHRRGLKPADSGYHWITDSGKFMSDDMVQAAGWEEVK